MVLVLVQEVLVNQPGLEGLGTGGGSPLLLTNNVFVFVCKGGVHVEAGDEMGYIVPVVDEVCVKR